MPTVVAMLCRFYGWRAEDVAQMTLTQIGEWFKQISEVMAIENGKPDKHDSDSIEASAQTFPAVASMFPRGRGPQWQR